MTTIPLRDLVRGPSLLSLLRIPLAMAFLYALGRDGWPWAILLASALTDVADGWYARWSGQVTRTGAFLDAVTDKIFVAVVVIALLVARRLSISDVVALSIRDLGELALIAHVGLIHHRPIRATRRVHPLGKATTVLQYLTVGAAVGRLPITEPLAALTGLTGVLAAAAYWAEEG